MKDINTYIIEKILINKDTKVKHKNIIPYICASLQLKYFIDIKSKKFSDIYNKIQEWVNDNNIYEENKILPCADKETMSELDISHMNSEKIKYNTDYSINELCQVELNKAKCIYSSKDEGIDIYANNNMICNITSAGTFYVIIKSKFNL